MRRTVWTLLLLFGLCVCAAAQGKPGECPFVSITGPAGIVKEGDVSYYVVKIGPSKSIYNMEFVWTVSGGKIQTGQGTARIGVVLSNSSETNVRVEVKGLPAVCPNVASETSIFERGLLPPMVLDRFPFSFSPTLDDRLRKIAEASNNNPNSQLYIFVPPDPTVRGAISERLQNVISAPKIDLRRITFVENASKNSAIQVWLVPPGATPPSKCEGCEPPPESKAVLAPESKLIAPPEGKPTATPESKPTPTPAIKSTPIPVSKLPAPPENNIAPAPSSTAKCPTLEISGPTGTTLPGNIMPFVVLVSEPRMRNLTFTWTSSAGTIVEGQGVRVVKIKAPMQKTPVDLTATVRISGLPQGCQNTASLTRPVAGL